MKYGINRLITYKNELSIPTKTDGRPRTVELRTSKGRLTKPVQKLAIPETQIIDEDPAEENSVQSNLITLPIESIAFPEIFNGAEISQYLNSPKSNKKNKINFFSRPPSIKITTYFEFLKKNCRIYFINLQNIGGLTPPCPPVPSP